MCWFLFGSFLSRALWFLHCPGRIFRIRPLFFRLGWVGFGLILALIMVRFLNNSQAGLVPEMFGVVRAVCGAGGFS